MIKRRIARTQDRRGRDSLVRTIRLRLDLSDWLDAAAAQMGVAANSLVVLALNKARSEHDALLGAAERAEINAMTAWIRDERSRREASGA